MGLSEELTMHGLVVKPRWFSFLDNGDGRASLSAPQLIHLVYATTFHQYMYWETLQPKFRHIERLHLLT